MTFRTLVVCCAIACFSPLPAATIVVDLTGSGDYSEIQPAIDAAKDGDQVLARAGIYVISQPIDFNRLHDPDDPASPPLKNITLHSEAGAEKTTIRKSDVNVVFDASVIVFEHGESRASLIEGFTLTGGIFSNNSAPNIKNCTITDRVECGDSTSPTFMNCTIGWRPVWGVGRGLQCGGDASPVFTNCTITGNGTPGVACGVNASPIFTNCLITNNHDGVSCHGNAFPKFANCIIAGNAGRGVYCTGNATPIFMNCTIAGNTSYVNAAEGVSCWDNSSPSFTNCIIRGDTGPALEVWDCAIPCVSYSCVQGSIPWPGKGNINNDPLLVWPGAWEECDPASGEDCFPYGWDVDLNQPEEWRRWDLDYHLQPGSPCIDAGTTEGTPTTDIEGNGRPCGFGVDMGAYEMGGCPPPEGVFRRGDTNADSTIDIADAIFTLSYLFADGLPPSCLDAADANDDGAVDISDGVFMLQNLFANGPAIPPPYPECGVDPTEDELDCAEYAHCE